MQKKSKKKRTAIALFISGIGALILAFVMLGFGNGVKDEVGPYIDNDEEKAIELINGFTVLLFVDAGIELIPAMIMESKASEEEKGKNISVQNSASTAFCSHCGASLQAGAEFCSGCGHKV